MIALDGAGGERPGRWRTAYDRTVVVSQRRHRLIRADNLQRYPATVDVRRLAAIIGVRAVADLRRLTRRSTPRDPDALTREAAGWRIEHLSPPPRPANAPMCYRSWMRPRLPSSAPNGEADRQQYLPVSGRAAESSVLAVARLMATTAGANASCIARLGKTHRRRGGGRTGRDRRGSLAQSLADYARSSGRIAGNRGAAFRHPVYAPDLAGKAIDSQAVRPQTMEAFFAELDARFGGTRPGELREQVGVTRTTTRSTHSSWASGTRSSSRRWAGHAAKAGRPLWAAPGLRVTLRQLTVWRRAMLCNS